MKPYVTFAVLGVLLASSAAAVAQGPAVVELGPNRGAVTLTWDEFVKITGYDPAKKGSTITVPWKEVQDLLGVEVKGIQGGTSIDLPWAEFKELMKWSIERKAQGEKKTPAPTPYIVASSEYGGAVGEESAKLVLKAKINVLQEKGWKRIPLLPANVAIIKSTLPDGVHINGSQGYYELLTEKAGEMEVTVEFTVRVQESAGVRSLNFQRMLPGSSVLDLTIDQADLDVKVTASQSLVAKPDDGKTKVAAVLPTNVQLTMTWERALKKMAVGPPKLYAETRTLAAVSEGLLLCQERIQYNILHAGVRELKLTAPAGANLLTVSGQNVSDWRVDKDGTLDIVLRGEAIGSYGLYLSYEAPLAADTKLPVIHPRGVERERGYIGVIALSNVEISSGEVTGATEIDTRNLPADLLAMTKQPVLLGYRTIGADAAIPLVIRKHEEVPVLVTIADSALYTCMQLNDGRRITKAVMNIRNNRSQFLRAEMPAGVDIWSLSVAGKTAAPAKDKTGKVLIPLVRSTSSAKELASFPVEIVYVETPDKKAPSAGTLRVNLPMVDVPVMHVMFNYYLPAEGKYTTGGGLFGGPEKLSITGPLRPVDAFASLSTGPGARVIEHDAQANAAGMQQAFDQQVAEQARATGARPIRVQLPVDGTLFRLEKILALPSDKLFFELAYSGWKTSE